MDEQTQLTEEQARRAEYHRAYWSMREADEALPPSALEKYES
jgi:hypothetical protein